MLTTPEKRFFATMARTASELSECNPKQGTVLIKGRKIISYGYNKKISTKGPWEMSAVYDAIFSSYRTELMGTTLFSNYFPILDDLKMIIACGIETVYFFGSMKNAETVKLANAITEDGIPLQFIRLS